MQRVRTWPLSDRRRAGLCTLGAVVCCLAAPVAAAQDSLVPPPAPAQSEPAPPVAPPTTRPVDLRPRPLGEIGAQRAAQPRPQDRAPGVAEASGPPSGSHAAQTALALGLVLALILALAAGARKLARSRGTLGAALGAMGASPAPAGILEVLGRYPIARGTSIVLLKVDRRVLVLSQTGTCARLRGGGATLATLCEIADPEEVASIVVKANEAEGRSIGSRFREALRTFERAHDGVVEQPRPSLFGRLISRGSGGDTTELLDAQALADQGDPLRFADFDQQGSSVVGSLRSRLTALRTGGAA